ncbi:MAG: 4Fe-4S dicluster domain-containing protein [Deltaproteobacteria bacterium]|nr:4Fe-4S dicluster domain-containing protein [Deltaproteobacteria bacterium]MBW2050961.1 4Fe-4S dicluster domain-containing protein [Deltaproteobacteria bacterium]MBW2139632.1 4Fe-4S dicluster domain-containing protein [Deltaproteobacteria bacterium]MBW2322256.1 4Fe-4S dicluster domain-containing protein [Deltaproteobacteria bacterium]
MESSRRKFLKIAGLSVLGLGAKPVIESFAQGIEPTYSTDKKALKGKKWAMVIDVDKCKDDCEDCIAACHRGHNVPKIDNVKHEIKWIWHEEFKNAFPAQEYDNLAERLEHKPFMVLCNHCTNPPCVRVCPTKATFKREDGIVLMDFHRCIGCRFCMAACPYGSRSFNWFDPRKYLEVTSPDFPTRSKGVVEKCNFCAERLAIGKIPLCVEACKEEALVFGDLEDPNSPVKKILKERYAIRRKPSLGTGPNIFYVI